MTKILAIEIGGYTGNFPYNVSKCHQFEAESVQYFKPFKDPDPNLQHKIGGAQSSQDPFPTLYHVTAYVERYHDRSKIRFMQFFRANTVDDPQVGRNVGENKAPDLGSGSSNYNQPDQESLRTIRQVD